MKNLLSEIITKVEKEYFITFKPTKEFYKKVGIRQKAWSKMLKNEMQPNASQIYALCQVFKVAVEEIVPQPEQLELFERKMIVIDNEKSKIIEELKNTLGHKQLENFEKIIC